MKKKIIKWFEDYPAAKWVCSSVFFIWLAAFLFANGVNPSYGIASIFTGVVTMITGFVVASD